MAEILPNIRPGPSGLILTAVILAHAGQNFLFIFLRQIAIVLS